MAFEFLNTYADLPGSMFTRQAPVPVQNPALIAVNPDLARELGLDPKELTAQILSGNVVPDGAAPLAQLYAGHQFGHWNPQLGDGRALLLGEVAGRDIQLKGSGPTPYSRNGDGRSWLGPVLREYIVSEAMHALGVPTTRALGAVTTGETVYRQTALPGAILTRVAASHIRVGTFQVFAARDMKRELQALADYAIARHFPHAQGPSGLLKAVVKAQAHLVAKWMGLGFIHGVMNTDNCAISGETIDYGPCAFLDGYAPGKVFSSIDQTGRYAYGNQPRIANWNLAQFATALIPLMPNEKQAIEEFTVIVNEFGDIFEAEWLKVFGAKIGLADPIAGDALLIEKYLDLLASSAADFTQSFAALRTDNPPQADEFQAWADQWQARSPDDQLMARSNPYVIPRNHLIEAVIEAGVAGDFAPFHQMLAAVTTPFTPNATYAAAPTKDQEIQNTFCGT